MNETALWNIRNAVFFKVEDARVALFNAPSIELERAPIDAVSLLLDHSCVLFLLTRNHALWLIGEEIWSALAEALASKHEHHPNTITRVNTNFRIIERVVQLLTRIQTSVLWNRSIWVDRIYLTLINAVSPVEERARRIARINALTLDIIIQAKNWARLLAPHQWVWDWRIINPILACAVLYTIVRRIRNWIKAKRTCCRTIATILKWFVTSTTGNALKSKC